MKHKIGDKIITTCGIIGTIVDLNYEPRIYKNQKILIEATDKVAYSHSGFGKMTVLFAEEEVIPLTPQSKILYGDNSEST